MHRDERDDQLGGVPEGRVEEAADPGPRVLGSVLRRLADQPGEGDEGGRGEDELDRLVEVCEVVQRDRERPDEKTGEEDAADHERQPYPCRQRCQHLSVTRPSVRAPTRFVPRRQDLRDRGRGCHHPGMSDVAPVTTAPAEIPLRPQDEVECRRCEVHCDRVVYPAACVARGCPFVYAYEAWGHTYMGCMQKVFDVEIDLDVLGELEARRDGFGAVKARTVAAADVPLGDLAVLRAPRRRGRLPEPGVLRAPAREPELPRVRAAIGLVPQGRFRRSGIGRGGSPPTAGHIPEGVAFGAATAATADAAARAQRRGFG